LAIPGLRRIIALRAMLRRAREKIDAFAPSRQTR
jgi:hypothetical protein